VSARSRIREQLYKSVQARQERPEYKAVVEASRATHSAPLDLLQKAGAIDSPYQFHWRRFLFENFPKARASRAGRPPPSATTCRGPRCRRSRSTIRPPPRLTTRSRCKGWETGTVTIGIHIAAPAWPYSATTRWTTLAARACPLSTCRLQDHHVADAVVQGYTLQEGRDCPAVSLYVALDEETLAIRATETRLERVPIARNLRHDQLDAWLPPSGWKTRPSYTRWSLQQPPTHSGPARTVVISIPPG